jgi:hypothetical protein
MKTRMMELSWLTLIIAGFGWSALATAQQGRGLVADREAADFSPWQLRLNLAVGSPSPLLGSLAGVSPSRVLSAQMLGDYYPEKLRLGQTNALRLTSGVIVGQRSVLRDPASLMSSRGVAMSHLQTNFSVVSSSAETAAEPVVTWPYLGIGYSGTDFRGNWSLKADLGLAAQNPGAARAGFGRVVGGSQNLDDFLRELRLSPMLQVGVSYAF